MEEVFNGSSRESCHVLPYGPVRVECVRVSPTLANQFVWANQLVRVIE